MSSGSGQSIHRRAGRKARLPRRWPLLWLADALSRLVPRRAKADVVLLVRPFGIGDALLFRLLLDAYKSALVSPGLRCVILGASDWKAVVPGFFDGETVILVEQRRYARNFFYRLLFNIRLRRLGVVRVVCPVYRRNPLIADAMVAATGAPERWVMQAVVAPKMQRIYAHYAPGMTRIVDTDQAGLRYRHELDRQLAFIGALAPAGWQAPPPADLRRLPGLAVADGGASDAVLINLGASYGPRRWPLQNWLAVAAQLAAAGRKVWLVGGPAERDLQPAVDAWLAAQAPAGVQAAIGSWSFAELIRRIRGAALVLSSDTGPAHLAAVLGVPVVVVLGGGHFGEFFPYPPAAEWAHVRTLLHRRDCYFCGWDCPYLATVATYPCISDVGVADMMAAITASRAPSDHTIP